MALNSCIEEFIFNFIFIETNKSEIVEKIQLTPEVMHLHDSLPSNRSFYSGADHFRSKNVFQKLLDRSQASTNRLCQKMY